MPRLFLVAAVLVAAFVALAHAEASEAEKQEFRRCTQLSDNGCAACSQEPGCGWCGVYTDQGFCVPATSDGAASDLAPFDINECPDFLWKGDTCDTPVRVVQPVEYQSDKIVWSTWSVASTTAADATFDALAFVLSTEIDRKDGQRRGGFGVLHGTAKVGDNIPDAAWEGNFVAFDTILEYAPTSGGAFRCASVGTGGVNDCEDWVNVKSSLPLRQWKNVNYTVTNPTTDSYVFVASAQTSDDRFALTCATSNADFEYEGVTRSPYSIKCDVSIRNYTYEEQTSQLALLTFAASAGAIKEGEEDPTTSLDFGDNAFFQWSESADILNAAGAKTGTSSAVVRSAVLLRDATVDFDATADVIVTVFSFTNAPAPAGLFWDPEIGISSPFKVSDSGAAQLGAVAFAVVALAAVLAF